MPTNPDAKDFLHALHGVTFPASRSELVGAAKDTGGLNGDVILALEQLPERTYATADDLTEEIGRIYAAMGVAAVPPAAASAISDANKRIVSAMADPRRDDGSSPEAPSLPGATPPADDAKAQAERILARNHELIEGTAEAGPEGEADIGVGHTVNSDRSHAGGDYASD